MRYLFHGQGLWAQVETGNAGASTGTGQARSPGKWRIIHVKTRMSLPVAILCCTSIVPMVAGADPWEVRREMREGARSVDIEKREAAREIRRCETRDCVKREVREGHREVNRERHEARNEIQRERTRRYVQPARYNSNARYYGDGRYYGSSYSDAHYHPNGQYCRDRRHIAHLRDGYYRNDQRWYRDGRYWNEYDYVSRYYGGQNRYRDDDDNDDLVRGIVIGAAAVGVIAAIHEANDDDLAEADPRLVSGWTGVPGYVSSRRRVAEPAWSNIFANCSLCFGVGRLRATRCWYVHSSVSACHVASTLLWWQAISVTGTDDALLTRQQLSQT